MTVRFLPPVYEGGRHLLRCGNVDVGAVFPAKGGAPGKWAWRVWVTATGFAADGQSKSELAAKNAALAVFNEFLTAAELQVKA